jgi:hypothetical protein
MSTLQITPVAFSIHRAGDNPVTGKSAIRIELADEGSGPFFRIWSADVIGGEPLRIDQDELDALCDAGTRLIRGSE